MLLALTIWLGIVSGILAISLIGGSLRSRRRQESLSSIKKQLVKPLRWIDDYRKAA